LRKQGSKKEKKARRKQETKERRKENDTLLYAINQRCRDSNIVEITNQCYFCTPICNTSFIINNNSTRSVGGSIASVRINISSVVVICSAVLIARCDIISSGIIAIRRWRTVTCANVNKKGLGRMLSNILQNMPQVYVKENLSPKSCHKKAAIEGSPFSSFGAYSLVAVVVS
jgi:hypothetical protein